MLIALRRMKHGSGFLEPGDPIPESLLKRNLRHYIQCGHIGLDGDNPQLSAASQHPETEAPAPAPEPGPAVQAGATAEAEPAGG